MKKLLFYLTRQKIMVIISIIFITGAMVIPPVTAGPIEDFFAILELVYDPPRLPWNWEHWRSGMEPKDYERLEFLGDAVLDLLTSEWLFLETTEEEGIMSQLRSLIVKDETLTEVGKELGIDKHLRTYSRYQVVETDLEDVVEAIIGAVYLDAGLNQAGKFINRWIITPSLEDGSYRIDKNYKGQLLELTHAKKLPPPIYNVIKEEGEEHNKTFTIEVIIDNKNCGTGQGRSKKDAEQLAAEKALELLS